MRGCGWRCMVGIVGLCGIAVSSAMAEDKPEALLGWSKQAATEGPCVQVGDAFMVPYRYTIPGTDIACDMIPVPGGTVKMGSPESEPGRSEDEGPVVEVEVAPFWMAKVEVRWAEYRQFMGLYKIFKALQSQKIRRVTDDNRVDAITVPTPLYEPDHTFEFGDDPDQPAVTMTQYAAKQYSKWLSGMTGQQLRLPTAAEWEHAARSGTQSPYSFGDSADQLDQYAYHAGNSPDGPGKVGTKMPNPWGLHDMHGNVWEWVIDGYSPEGYTELAGQKRSLLEAIQRPAKPSPRTVRGGGWQDPPERLRSAARLGSDDEEWKSEDPNIPNSPWWFTTDPSRQVGFRLVRSAQPLDSETMKLFWEIDHEDIQLDVQLRLEEGRGAEGLPVPELAEELKKNQ